MAKTNPFEEFMEVYRPNPVAFCENVLGVKPLKWQGELLESLAAGERRISVRSGHNCGKSSACAFANLWFLLTHYDTKIAVTAPSAAQIFDALAAETKKWINRRPDPIRDLLEVKSDRIELKSAPESNFISYRTARLDNPSALQGLHALHTMLCIDEAAGVPQAVWEAAYGSMAGGGEITGGKAHVILLGNPTTNQGFFFDSHTVHAKTWKTMHVSCLDNPLVSQDYIDEVRMKYGQDPNQYRIRVEGEWPLHDSDAIISHSKIMDATKRDVPIMAEYPNIWGVDVARYGDASSCLVQRKARKILEPIYRWRKLSLVELAGRIAELYDAADQKPFSIEIDSIGIGAGCLDILKSEGYPARGVAVSEGPARKDIYANLRAELWFRMRDWFHEQDVQIPGDKDLIRDLSSVRFLYRPNGKIACERKELTQQRIGASPDSADALLMTFASNAVDSQGRFRTSGPQRRHVGNIV